MAPCTHQGGGGHIAGDLFSRFAPWENEYESHTYVHGVGDPYLPTLGCLSVPSSEPDIALLLNHSHNKVYYVVDYSTGICGQ